jgi:hypothetical protein
MPSGKASVSKRQSSVNASHILLAYRTRKALTICGQDRIWTMTGGFLRHDWTFQRFPRSTRWMVHVEHALAHGFPS